MNFHGEPPYRIAVIHGGPGAAGEMVQLAEQLACAVGVLEPYQTETTLSGQIDELTSLLRTHGDGPLTLVGFSWGAWLSCMVAAREPALVNKLVLVSSAPFEETYAADIRKTRFSRLSDQARGEVEELSEVLSDKVAGDKDAALARIGALFETADAYNALPDDSNAIDCQADIFLGVWNEAAALRRSGELLTLAQSIQCPVVAIHGDHDPHPADGVEHPLSRVIADFRFVLLNKCGHRPWLEKEARSAFFCVLQSEIR